MTTYTLVSKGGRSRTGSDKKGSLIHVVNEPEQNGFWSTPALCGAKLTGKGYGWLRINPEYSGITCPKCQKLFSGKING